MNRTPALTKNEIRPKTAPMRSVRHPLADRVEDRDAVAIEYAISCTGVAPASCR